MLILFLACAGASTGDSATLDPGLCTPATPDDITQRRGDYYRCVDSQLSGPDDGAAGCGSDGYPLGFGAKYADRYLDETFETLTEPGQAFFLTVSPCLQDHMAAWIDADSSCQAVWTNGFASHQQCYLDSGFCELGTADVLKIGAALDPEDLALPEVAALFSALMTDCAAGPGQVPGADHSIRVVIQQ